MWLKEAQHLTCCKLHEHRPAEEDEQSQPMASCRGADTLESYVWERSPTRWGLGCWWEPHEPSSDCAFLHYVSALWGAVTCQRPCDTSTLPAMKRWRASVFPEVMGPRLMGLLLYAVHQHLEEHPPEQTVSLPRTFIPLCTCSWERKGKKAVLLGMTVRTFGLCPYMVRREMWISYPCIYSCV